jgi:hypothetical protein
MVGISESIVLDLLYKYGEKAYLVLKTAYELYKVNVIDGRKVLGDFDFKSLVSKLREKGFNYNPNQLLRIMERDFGVIETTYRSSNQRWWRFTDPTAISKALDIYEGRYEGSLDNDPEVTLLKLQVEVVDIDGILNFISELSAKNSLTVSDKSKLKQMLFNDIPIVVKLFKETQNYENYFKDFNSKVRLMFKYLNILIKKFKGINIDLDVNEKEEQYRRDSLARLDMLSSKS